MNEQVLQFDDGSVTLRIRSADGPTITWNPNDSNFVDRLLRFQDEFLVGLGERIRNIKGLNSVEVDENGEPKAWGDGYEVGTIEALGSEFKAELDKVFNAPISETVFANVNPISPTAKGSMVYENFFEALMPIIEKSFAGFAASREKYTNRFKKK